MSRHLGGQTLKAFSSWYNHTMEALPIEYPTDWKDYELIDSGNGEKLERFGTYTMVRPDPRALWDSALADEVWQKADAVYVRTDPKTGEWQTKTPPPNPWHIHYDTLTFTLRPTEFKHVGIFPEQAINWNWLKKQIDGKPLKILNLFAYTGGATMVASHSGAHVTHVDSAKSTIDWAHENVKASGLDDKPIRWIEEDAYKFVQREARRGNTYDGIIMDPPRFGRGSKGEVWKLEDHLPKLLKASMEILSPTASFFLLNAYTADLSAVAISNLLASYIKGRSGQTSFGELALKDSSGRLLPNGIFARWSAK
jgi:23S rRNA (cytosine1962-C5)-methyltransferase